MPKLYTRNTWIDEVLSGSQRYNILENNGAAFKANMQINLATAVGVAGTSMTANYMNNLEAGVDALDNLLNSMRNAASQLTITSDAITITQSNHKLQPQSGTSDTLSTINGTVAGQSGVLYAADYGTDTITIAHNVGNILCMGGSNISLSYGAVFWYSDGTKVFCSGGSTALETAYKITPTVVSNDLVLTITHADGSTPSTTRPLWFYINNNWRACTAALSVTKADGTSWAGLGGTAFGTIEQDLFVYITWNTNLAPDAIDVFWARIPHGQVYSNFSGITTNERYAAINATAPAPTDDCINIGRFAATLSLSGTSHLWTVPTYTTENLIQEPADESRWLTWAPTAGASGSMTYTSVTFSVAKYKMKRYGCELQLNMSGTTGGIASNILRASQPFSHTGGDFLGGCLTDSVFGGVRLLGGNLEFLKYNLGNFNLGTVAGSTSGFFAVT